MSAGDALAMYTIYWDPVDYPGKFVVRRFDVSPRGLRAASEPLAVVDTLEAARGALPPFLHNLHRQPDDEPQIMETWT